MAKILYGVLGEGFGHSSRSHAVSTLLRGHQILFAGSRKSYNYLAERGHDVFKISGPRFELKDHKIDLLKTIQSNVTEFDGIGSFSKLLKKAKEFDPDIVISDFEPISAIVAKILNKPLLSIDHQNLIDRSKIDVPKEIKAEMMATRVLVSYFVRDADLYLVSTFFFPEIIKKNTILIPPIIRKEVTEAKSTEQDYTLVYQSYPNDELCELLSGIRQKFVIYGTEAACKSRNMVYKKRSTEGFLKDLAGCKAVITNGGYTLISECLHLKKPVLSMPIAGQPEQLLNAHYLDLLGYGKYYDELDDVKIIGFLHNQDKYKKNLKRFKSNGNMLAKKHILSFLRKNYK